MYVHTDRQTDRQTQTGTDTETETETETETREQRQTDRQPATSRLTAAAMHEPDSRSSRYSEAAPASMHACTTRAY